MSRAASHRQFSFAKEYDHISKLIDGLPRSGDGPAVVSGQLGTGEPLVSPSRSI